jgi:predicted TIM-barrel fold metal-dependent hydrolase
MNFPIIDADAHISPPGQGGNSQTLEQLLQSLDYAGVDKALAWLQPPYLREIDEANQYIYQAMQNHPDRILGFGWVDPNLGVSKALDMAKKCLYEYDLFGVKLNGAQNSYYIDDLELTGSIIEEIAQSGKVLAFHVGADAYEYTHPFRVAKIAKMYPELKILMVHMGGAAVPDLSDAAIEFAAECPNITLIGSAIDPPAILKAIKTLGTDRVCFGSDTPFQFVHVELAKYMALLKDEVDQEGLTAILGGNIMRILGLQI